MYEKTRSWFKDRLSFDIGSYILKGGHTCLSFRLEGAWEQVRTSYSLNRTDKVIVSVFPSGTNESLRSAVRVDANLWDALDKKMVMFIPKGKLVTCQSYINALSFLRRYPDQAMAFLSEGSGLNYLVAQDFLG